MTAVAFRAVLFDMDGTLVHTAPDIASALNAALDSNGLRTFDPADIVDLVGKGARILVSRAMAKQGVDNESRQAAVLVDYEREYGLRIGSRGHAFPGALECLRSLQARGIKTAVVTNALQRFAEATLALHGLTEHLDIIIGGDRALEPKPHPAALWLACRTLDVEPRETLMVGDSLNDVAAARAAGCSVVCVPHGYNEGRPTAELDCEIIENLAAVVTCVGAELAQRP